MEGEAISNYLAELLREFSISVTRLAEGQPAGVGLKSAGELTLSHALSGRVKLWARPGVKPNGARNDRRDLD